MSDDHFWFILHLSNPGLLLRKSVSIRVIRGSFDTDESERSMSDRTVQSLYVHVPFCARKCSYCAFYSEASNGDVINQYIAALLKEMDLITENLLAKIIFSCGDTPSIVSRRPWEFILK